MIFKAGILVCFFTAFFLFALETYSQISPQIVFPNENNGDKSGAILVLEDSIYCKSSPNGFGNIQEIAASRTDSSQLEKEHNSVWYKIIAKEDGLMEFVIIPEQIMDDYDFMLFLYDSKTKTTQAVRVNKARNNTNQKSQTGLRKKVTRNFVGEGPGDGFSAAQEVKKGQVFYLLIDNVYSGGKGHSLIFSWEFKNQIPEKQGYNLSLLIKDKETDKPMEADVAFIRRNYAKADDTVFMGKGFHFFLPMDSGATYIIKAKADSFLIAQNEFKVYQSDTFKEVVIPLQRVSIGKIITLENIYFGGGSAVMLRKSLNSVKELAQTLEDNPTLQIEIQGHVNQPFNQTKRNKESYYQDLSEARAKAVYDYLIKRKIDPSRLSYKGFGYSKMIFPYAKNPTEEQQNRRVEILVMEI
ncbi:MAG: OmpA family protein [Bacteroidales bacterium]|nr:OmpA family protein [Bacteroidales bacterium]